MNNIKNRIEDAIAKEMEYGNGCDLGSARDKCYEITKESMKAFDEWKRINEWHHIDEDYYTDFEHVQVLTFDELIDLFVNDQKEK